MDWRTVQFDWNRARAFLVTAEEGSLSAAARALGMAQPTVGRQVEALERELDVVLFARVGRRYELTEAGLELLEHVRTMGDAASRVSLAASGQSQDLSGLVSISASEIFAARLLPDMIAELRTRHPGIAIEIVATNAQSDLRRREADIAVRNVRPQHPELVGKKVRDMDGYLYAASTYLDRVGRPKTPDELSQLDFIGFDRTDQLTEVLNGLGLSLTPDSFPLISQSHLVMWSMVRRGLGVSVMAGLVGDAEPGVERALPSLPPVPFPVWLVSHRELHTSRRVRAVFDLLDEAFSAL